MVRRCASPTRPKLRVSSSGRTAPAGAWPEINFFSKRREKESVSAAGQLTRSAEPWTSGLERCLVGSGKSTCRFKRGTCQSEKSVRRFKKRGCPFEKRCRRFKQSGCRSENDAAIPRNRQSGLSNGIAGLRNHLAAARNA